LQNRGFEVRSAASVPEALAAINRQTFDILLSDLNVSEEGDGFTIVHAMRTANPKCITILLTGYPAFESAVEAIHHEVDDYFVKPADVESLIASHIREDITPVPSEEAIGNLKFGDCLPPSIAGEVFAARFNDPEAIAAIRREPMRVVIEGSASPRPMSP